ncbi:hypothetical protein HU200_029466 [Digitaria exilis]|uniref:F-box domain-containing protein n=1 Tax=Digitaria exilis TaxID=1010633 RepID=A0A835ES79_9POAL|nr:hypothetical protein HU200_029466 [Digitaria exilis]
MASSSQHPRTQRGDDGELSGSIDALLHRDALHEILLRVPAKALYRFRTVCQSWRSLLSAPSFVAAHAARHGDDQPLLAVCGWVPGTGRRAAEFKLLDTLSGHVVKRFDVGPPSLLRRVWSSSHLDLVLIVRRVDHHHRTMRDDRRPLSVLDPATGDVTVLPGGCYDDTRTSFVFGRVAAASSSSTGEGDGEYKFCKILTVGGGGGSRGAWRDAPAPPVHIKTFHRGEAVVAGGVVYHLVDCSGGWTIAAFDLGAEQWLPDLLHGPAEPPAPPANSNSREGRSLAEVNGRLAAVYSTTSAMEMWQLMGSGKKAQWCKRCRVLMSFMDTECRYWLTPDPVPLWVMDDGRVAFWLRGLSQSGTLWIYDPMTETCTRLANCLRMGASGYTGSLLRQ